MDRARHGKEFLAFAAANKARLLKGLRKNVGCSKEEAGDAYADALLAIHETIMEKGVKVKDFERYFFRAVNFAYLRKEAKDQSRLKAERKMKEGEDFVEEEEEETAADKIEILREFLCKTYDRRRADIFLDYMRIRTSGVFYSYRAHSHETGIPRRELEVTIRNIRAYLRRNKNKLKEIWHG